MRLFDLFKPKAQNKLTQDNPQFAKAMREEFEETKREVEELQNENASWQKEFDTIINHRTKASSLEKEGKLQEAIEIYSRSILFGESSQRLNLNNYAYDIERIIILYNKTKQKTLLSDFLEQLISKYPNFRDAQKWAVKLSSLKEFRNKITKLTQDIINKPIPNKPTLGQNFQLLLHSFPKFNFYYDMPLGMNTFEYLSIRKPVPFEKSSELKKYKDNFETILNKARIAENENDLKSAIEAYEKLIVEEYQDTQPYERLMIIYRKLQWQADEIRVIQSGISFFLRVKEQQRNDVSNLAREFNMLHKALEYIESNKKIFYFGGAFELYNPYPIIEKWTLRLLKMNKQIP